MSSESNRRTPYSTDLRWKVVYQKLGKNFSLSKIASNLSISIIGVGSGGARGHGPPNIGYLSKASLSFVLPVFQVILHLYG